MTAGPVAAQPAEPTPESTSSALHGTTLPGPMIDLIRDGITSHALARQGSKAVYKALRSTAISAQLRGWTEARWLDLVDNPYRSALARQNGMTRTKERTDKARRKTLADAWKSAASFLTNAEPAWSKGEAQEHARCIAAEVIAHVSDAEIEAGILPSDAAVLRAAAELAIERGSDRLTISREKMVDLTPHGISAVRNALRRLDDRGALVLVSKGSPRAKGKKPTASVYQLRSVTLWENPVSGAPQAVSGAPSPGAPAVSGAPGEGLDAVSGAPGRYVTIEQVAEALGGDAAATLDALVAPPILRVLPGGRDGRHGPAAGGSDAVAG